MSESKNIKRARSAEDKESRKESILIAAQTLFEDNSDALPSVSLIAKQANVSKGNVYNYFLTKEEIYLTLLQRGYENWLKVIYEALTKVEPSVERFLSSYVNFCQTEIEFMRLVALAPMVLEKNISVETTFVFKKGLAQEVKSISKLIVTAFPEIKGPERAAQLFLSSYSLTVGLWSLCFPSGIVKQVTDNEELSILRPNFEDILLRSLSDMWFGALKGVEK